jgi:hypothetical protein
VKTITQDNRCYVVRDGQLIEVETVNNPLAPKRRRTDQLATVIPNTWKYRLFESRNAYTIKVGIELQFLWFKAFRKPFPFTNIAAARIGVGRTAKSRILAELEDLGLIEVGRRRCKSPLITVLNY